MSDFDRTPSGFGRTPGSGQTERVSVTLDDGSVFLVEVPSEAVRGREDVSAGGAKAIESLSQSIKGIVKTVTAPLKAVKPSKATLTLGLEIGIEQGSLVAAIVRGTGKTNLEITLEWEKQDIEQME